MRLAAVLINYRTGELTMRAVEALLKELETIGSFHVYVVDNDSRDGSYETMCQTVRDRDLGDRVSVLASPRNGGYGFGINFAVRIALSRPDPPEHVYIINTDAFPTPGSLAKLLRFMDGHPDAGMVGSRIDGEDGQTQGAAFRFPTVWSELERGARLGLLSGLLRRYIVSMPDPKQDTEVDWLAGTSLLIRRAVFDAGVYFDEKFFLYFEEVDFARELSRAGFRAHNVADAPIIHIGSVSTGVGDMSRPLPKYWFESRHRYFLKHHGRGYTAACDAAWLLGHQAFLVKQTLLGRSRIIRPRLLRDFLRASLRQLREGGRRAA
jgi:N-acetylglucosaminyl-diphospho-decaprenol L-rhamnosyltransferase